jgi:hypothetical protein
VSYWHPAQHPAFNAILKKSSWAWWFMLVIKALRLRQKYHKFDAFLGYIGDPGSKKGEKIKINVKQYMLYK